MIVRLVYGCPCSGKSTFARSNAGENDIIYDCDALVRAISTKTVHDTINTPAKWVAVALRRKMLEASAGDDKIENFFFLSRWKTESVAEILDGFEVVEQYMDVTKDECYRRLESDDTRPDKEAWRSIIDEWFEKYGPKEDKEDRKEVAVMDKFWNWTNKKAEDADGEEIRVLHLEGAIASEPWWDDDVTPQMFKDELNAGTGPIDVWINSPGGDVCAGAQIYNMLMEYPHDVHVKIDGLAASAASVIAMAGTTVSMSPVALMMIHNPSMMAWGDAAEMKRAMKSLEEVKESIINAYEIRTDLSRNQISKMMDDETWFNAKKAVELGFADEVLYQDGTTNLAGTSITNCAAYAFSKAECNASAMAQLAKGEPEPAEPQTEPEPLEEPEGVPVSLLQKRLNLLRF